MVVVTGVLLLNKIVEILEQHHNQYVQILFKALSKDMINEESKHSTLLDDIIITLIAPLSRYKRINVRVFTLINSIV